MLVALEDLVSAVERVKAEVADAKNENLSILIKCDKDAGKMLVAYADGHKAVCSDIDTQYDAEETVEEEIVASLKQVTAAVEVLKPVGVVKVDEVFIRLDPTKKQISFEAEKYVMMAEDENAEEAEKQVVAKMQQSFAYIRMEDDKRQRILKCVDYAGMLKIAEANADGEAVQLDNWDRQKFISVLSKMTNEDGQMVIFSGKNKNVRVSNTSYAVSIPCDEVKLPLCIPVKTAKNIIDILKKSPAETVDIKVAENAAIVCTDNQKVAIWFETAKPLNRVINILNAYGENKYENHQLVVLKDVITNAIKCVGEDVTNIEFTFNGDAVNGYTMNVGGGSSTVKSNKFDVSLAGVSGDNEGLLTKKFIMNNDTVKAMLNLCDGTFVGMEFGAVGEDENGAWSLRVCEISKVGGVVERDTECYTMVTMTAK